jgi:cobalt/nickel transport system permease protein
MWSKNTTGRSAKDRRMTGLHRAASGISALEEYALKDSTLARIHPGAKLLAAAVYIVCVASFPAYGSGGIAAFVLYPAVLLALSNIPAGKLFKRLIPVLPFALMGGIGNIIVMRKPAFMLGGVVISVGMVSFAVIMLKAVLCAQAVLILIGSTPFHIICAELRRFRVPRIVCIQLALMYRYISTLIEEASWMYTAYMLRSAFKEIRMKDMGAFLGGLALRSMDKAARVYNAMKCRGWAGAFYAPPRKSAAADFFYCFFISGLCIVFRFINIPLFLGNLFHA